MKVDIIMPTHNPTQHTVEALESCLAQSYKNVQVTVIDDCSTQDISFLKKRFPKVNFLKTPKNLGPGGARNYGIERTSGDLVSFLDDDDIMHRDKVYLSVEALKSDRAAGMVCGNYRIFVNGRVRKQFYSRAISIDHKKLMKQNFVASGSVTVRREVLEAVGGFSEKYWIAEDYDLWLKISEKYSIKYLHRVLYFYRIVPGGNSLTQRSDIQKKHVKNLEEIKKASLKRLSDELESSKENTD
jgi:glycosyltransferase involved in cell wall biosynthesis